MKKDKKIHDIASIFERIKGKLEVGTYKAALDKLGIKRGTFDAWNQRENIPDGRLYEIANKLNVTIEWLETGKEDNVSIVKEPSVRYGTEDEEEELIPMAYFPDVHGSAGGGAVYPHLDDSVPVGMSQSFLELHLGLRRHAGVFIVNVTGDSMEPTLHDGALIFVNPIENEPDAIRDGAIYLLICEDMMLVKRVRVNPIEKTYTLVSDNDAVAEMVISSPELNGCRFVGRVVGSFDRV